jgi:hypothetical protein
VPYLWALPPCRSLCSPESGLVPDDHDLFTAVIKLYLSSFGSDNACVKNPHSCMGLKFCVFRGRENNCLLAKNKYSVRNPRFIKNEKNPGLLRFYFYSVRLHVYDSECKSPNDFIYVLCINRIGTHYSSVFQIQLRICVLFAANLMVHDTILCMIRIASIYTRFPGIQFCAQNLNLIAILTNSYTESYAEFCVRFREQIRLQFPA